MIDHSKSPPDQIMHAHNPNIPNKTRQQIEENLEIISTLSYLIIQIAKSGDNEIKLCAATLQHVGKMIQTSGVNLEELLERT